MEQRGLPVVVVNEAKMASRFLLLFALLCPAFALGQSLPQPQVRMQPENDNSNRAASTAYVDRSVQMLLNSLSGKAPLASPAFTGTASFANRPTFGGATPWDSGNLNPSAFAPLSNPTFTGTAKADTLQILGSGSTGDGSGFSVRPIGSGGGGVGRSLAERFSETVNLLDYARCDGTNERSALIAALAAVPVGGTLYVPPGKTCRFDGSYSVSTANVTLSMAGATLVLGGGLAAGDKVIAWRGSGGRVRGGRLAMTTRTVPVWLANDAAPVRDFHMDGVQSDGYFYYLVAGRIDLTTHAIEDVKVTNALGTAAAGQNAGGTMFYGVDGFTVSGNSFRNAMNSSVIGIAAGSRNGSVTDNRVRGVRDTAAIVEAGIQVEDCPNANIVISGNVTDHDVWIDDSSNVTIGANDVRRYRFTASGTTGDLTSLRLTGGKAGQLNVAAYGPQAGQRIYLDVDALTLDPAGKALFGSPLESSIYAEGGVVGRLSVSRLRTISSASATAVRLSRDAGARFDFLDSDFGSRPHAITGVAGVLNERNTSTPIVQGYISASLSTSPQAQGAWTTIPLNVEAADRNAEFSNGVFTPKEAGSYRFSGIISFVPSAAGVQMGGRLTKSTSGSAASEIARLVYEVAQGANFVCLPLRPITIYLTPNDTVTIEYFMTGGVNILTGATFSSIEIERVM